MAEADIDTSVLDELEAKLQSLVGSEQQRIQRKALKAVGDVVRPALLKATPISKGKRGSNSAPVGALRGALRSRVHLETDKSEAESITDFGRYNYVANFVDGGTLHAPANPFVRSTQDKVAKAVHDVYVQTLDEEIEKVLNGK